MGFAFLAPLFLAGLAAIAIPVLIHLTHRERKDAVPFPSLMFVRKIPYRTVRRQRIRHWLLFLMRSLAIVLVVAAFARPLLDRATQATAAFAQARELVLLLDRSHSMAYGDRWERARTAARQVINGVGPEDRATLVIFAEQAEAVSQRTADPSVLNAALASTVPGSGVTRYGPALQLARELLERSDRPAGEVVLISDFQKSGWDPRQVVRLPEGTRLTHVDLSDAAPLNLAVTGASLLHSREGGRALVTVSARLANVSAEPLREVRVSLQLDGEPVQTRSASLEANSSAMVRFAPVVLSGRPALGVIAAGDDALPGDNRFRFVLAPARPLSVLILEPRGVGLGHSLYLRRALGVGGEPGFDVEVKSVARLEAADLANRSVVVLNDASPTAAAARSLGDYVSRGGGLLVILGRRGARSAWSGAALELLPGTPGSPVDRSGEGGGTLGYLDYGHPILQLFRVPRSGDFSAPRFFRYHQFEVAEEARVLARFDDGSTALAEGQLGDGRVLVWSSDVENFWNDLTVQPVFLPFAHQMMKHLSGYVEPRAAYRVGEVVDLSLDANLAGWILEPAAQIVIESPSGGRDLLRGGPEARYLELREAGFYRIRRAENRAGPPVTVAANHDPAEADLTPIEPAELLGAVAAEAVAADRTEAATLSPEERERRQGLWWYLLFLAGALLLAETLMSNRASLRAGPGRRQGYADAT